MGYYSFIHVVFGIAMQEENILNLMFNFFKKFIFTFCKNRLWHGTIRKIEAVYPDLGKALHGAFTVGLVGTQTVDADRDISILFSFQISVEPECIERKIVGRCS